jgi:hypothetical protein
MKTIISIDQFLTEGGNIHKLGSQHIILDNNFDKSAVDPKTKTIIPVSIQFGEVKRNFNEYDKKYYSIQMYIVTYLKNDRETTKTVAGHLINVEVEVVLAESFK